MGMCSCGCGTTIGSKSAWARGHNQRVKNSMSGRPSWNKGQWRPLTAAHYSIEERGFTTPCWIWGGAISAATGYGRATVRGCKDSAHRAMWSQERGPVPPGMVLDHLCEVRACVNPDHLRVVRQRENVRRSKAAKVTHSDIALIRNDQRPQRQIGLAFGLSQQEISRIKRRERWTDI